MPRSYAQLRTRKQREPIPQCPFAPLRSVMEAQNEGQWLPGLLADQLGYSERTLCRWALRGSVPLDQFDRIAIKLGRHPDELLPGWDE